MASFPTGLQSLVRPGDPMHGGAGAGPCSAQECLAEAGSEIVLLRRRRETLRHVDWAIYLALQRVFNALVKWLREG